jgi:hypothetical protein
MQSVIHKHHSNASRFTALNGLLYVGLFMAGLVIPGLSGNIKGAYPTPWSDPGQIHAFYLANQSFSVAASSLQAVAAIALLAFAAVLAARIGKLAFGDIPSRMTLAGGIMAASFLMLGALGAWLTSRPEILADISSLRFAQDLAFLSGGVAHVLAYTLLIGVPSAVILGTGILPRWIGGLGVVVALISLLSVTSLANPALTLFLPLARFSSFIWIIAVSVVLFRERS